MPRSSIALAALVNAPGPEPWGIARIQSIVEPVAMPYRVVALLALLAMTQAWPVAAQPALTPEQERGLEDARLFVREFHRVYRPLYSVDVAVASWVGAKDLAQMAGVGVVYNLAAGKIYVSPSLLTVPYRDLLLSITLAHHMLRRPSTAGSLAELEREQRQQRLDANAKAVEVLVRARGLSEQAAFTQLASFLAAVPPAPPKPGQAPSISPCEQLRDLQARFPQYRDPVPAPYCAP
jgi:hypothetical protein